MANPILAFLGGGAASSASGMFNPATTTVSYTTNALMPIMLPELPELVNSFVVGDISAATFKEFALVHGRQYNNLDGVFNYTINVGGKASLNNMTLDAPRSINAKVLQQASFMPSINEAMVMLNRDLITPELFGHIVGRQTTFNPALVEVYDKLRYEIPGPADLIRFAVRDAYSPEIVQQFQYAKETPDAIKPWMVKQGYGEPIGIQLPPNATNAAGGAIAGEASWFDLYWWSHWDLPSPTQGYQMLHRLYATSDYGPSPFVTPETAFSSNDLSLLLKASDYPDYWRSRLMSISYHNLNRSDVIPMYERGLVDEATVYHALRSDGYRDQEAKVLVRLANFRKNAYLGIEPAKKAKEWVCKAYSEGMIARDNAITRLEEIGITRRFADAFLDSCDLEAQFNLNKERIRTLKRGFISGVVTEDGARNLLNRMNIQSRVIDRYLEVWGHLKFSRYKNASASKNLKAYSNGLINRNEVIARLQNLMYDSTAITTMVTLVDYEIGQRRLRQVTQQIKDQQRIAKQALAEQKKAASEARREEKKRETNIEKFNNKRMRKIIKASSDKNIIEWYKKELIELWEVFYRLYYKDYRMADAMKWVLNKLPDLEPEVYTNAENKAARVYRSEPNPPLS